jgi:hypothetical protein
MRFSIAIFTLILSLAPESHGLENFDFEFGIRRGELHVHRDYHLLYEAVLSVGTAETNCTAWQFPVCSEIHSNPWSALIDDRTKNLIAPFLTNQGKEIVVIYKPIPIFEFKLLKAILSDIFSFGFNSNMVVYDVVSEGPNIRPQDCALKAYNEYSEESLDGEIVAIQKNASASGELEFDAVMYDGTQLIDFKVLTDSLAGCLADYVISKTRAHLTLGPRPTGRPDLLKVSPQ